MIKTGCTQNTKNFESEKPRIIHKKIVKTESTQKNLDRT